MEANITVGTTYYVRNVVSSNTFTVSSTSGGANVNLAGNASPTEAMFANPASYLYICTDSYNSVANTVYVKATTVTTNKVTIDDTAKVTSNDPIILSANIGGLIANTVYYVVAIADVGANGNISVSATRTNGIAGANVTLSNASGNISSVSYNGTDIWKRIQLTSW
jgi:hypothetical protein